MSDERSKLVYLLKIAYSNQNHFEKYDEQKENIETMKRVISLNPSLTSEERNLLSLIYKNALNNRRNGLRVFPSLAEPKNRSNFLYQQINDFKELLLKELNQICLDLCNLIETKLLPVASTPEIRVYYEKLQADYYRYMAEFCSEDERSQWTDKAKQHYETAFDISKNDLSIQSLTYLGLVLNYSVFLYETIGRHQEAIDLASRYYSESVDSINDMSEGSFSEMTKILTLIKDNINNWKSQQDIQ